MLERIFTWCSSLRYLISKNSRKIKTAFRTYLFLILASQNSAEASDCDSDADAQLSKEINHLVGMMSFIQVQLC